MRTRQTRSAIILLLLLVALTFLPGSANTTAGTSDTSAPAESARADASQKTPEATDELVYVTKTGTKYHRAGCRFLSKSAIPIPLKEVGGKYQPCSVCAPPTTTTGTPSPVPRTGDAASGAGAAPPATQATASEAVYVTKTGTKYHRADCRFLAKSAIPMSLSDAATRYGPCSVCGPPTLSPTSEATAPGKATSTPAATTGRCAATTKAGTRCKRNAKTGSRYCWQHGG